MNQVLIRVFTDQPSADQWAADMEEVGFKIAPAEPVDTVIFRRPINGRMENAPIDHGAEYFVVMAYNFKKPTKAA